MDNDTGGAALTFRELPKEQQIELRNEYFKTVDAKKIKKIIITFAVVFAAIVITGAVLGVMTGYASYFSTTPVCVFTFVPVLISQKKFENWLMAEKNITFRRTK